MKTETEFVSRIPVGALPSTLWAKAPGEHGEDAKPESATLTPNVWFARRFPSLNLKYDSPVLIKQDREGNRLVSDISEDYLAATLSEEATPEQPTVFIPKEGRFYRYDPEEGLYLEQSEALLAAQLSHLLLQCAREGGGEVDVSNLKYRFRKTAALNGVVRRAKAILAVSADFFDAGLTEHIPCANGMLRLADKQLLPFSPTYRRRNKLAVGYDPSARCSKFREVLLDPALHEEDADLLQRWSGLALVGQNLSQAILFLVGTAGGGKGTFVRVLRGIVGRHMASLRTSLLGTRFELGRFLGRTLLYGADVPPDFLNCDSAGVLKSLTGGDPVTFELKNSNARPETVCAYNVIVTCNTHLRIRLQGDLDAWRRRLRIIQYEAAPPQNVIANLSDVILREEGPGVLNWMLEGLDKLRADGWVLRTTPRQQRIVENLLSECESHVRFVRDCLQPERSGYLTVDECFDRFANFCASRGWETPPKSQFSGLIEDAVRRQFGVSRRNDIPGSNGKSQRGWKGLGWKEGPDSSDGDLKTP